ncbi:SDR family NAD(P)-dependent oxidoreductase [Pasteurella testudinis]|uniref:SDR family NAD(P)-dependent oxidoreductase n=1 Tax=Pasteurella testudinis TaxID=761 RepID=UPI00405923FE
MNKRFENKVVIVTGGASGMGLEVAHRFVAEGAKVVIGGRDEAKLWEATKLIDPQGANVRTVAGDIAKPETAKELVSMATESFGGVDILINNAGIFNPKPFLELSEAEYDKFVDIILKGKFFMAQEAAKAMQKRGGGAIVQTGSLWALQAIAATPSAAYSAANAGVHALTHNLAIELASSNIRINTVAPAVIETPIYGTFMSEEQVKDTLPTFNNFHPIGRNGQPKDVAEAMLFLASEAASFITGTVLPVDGGVMAGH